MMWAVLGQDDWPKGTKRWNLGPPGPSPAPEALRHPGSPRIAPTKRIRTAMQCFPNSLFRRQRGQVCRGRPAGGPAGMLSPPSCSVPFSVCGPQPNPKLGKIRQASQGWRQLDLCRAREWLSPYPRVSLRQPNGAVQNCDSHTARDSGDRG